MRAERLRVAIDAHAIGRRQTGNETYIVELATALSRRNDVQPIAYTDEGVDWPRDDGPPVRRLRGRSRYVRLALELAVRARRDRADLLHVQYVAPPISGVPVVATIHDVSFLDARDSFPRRTALRMRLTIGATARRAALILTGSSFSRERLLDAYRLAAGRVVVTPYGVDPRWRRLPATEVSQTLAGSRLGELPERFVLAVGNLQPRKNIPRLVRAMAAVRSAGPADLALVLVGREDWGTSAIGAAIEEERGRDWVRSIGYVDDATLVALTNRATVVAYPSLYEGFGLPVLEALACGAVVVAGNRTAIPEVAGDAALLVDPTSDEAVASGLLAATTDEPLRRRLQAAGPRRAAEFTWDRCAAETVVAYRSAVGG